VKLSNFKFQNVVSSEISSLSFEVLTQSDISFTQLSSESIRYPISLHHPRNLGTLILISIFNPPENARSKMSLFNTDSNKGKKSIGDFRIIFLWYLELSSTQLILGMKEMHFLALIKRARQNK
jgi:hypothetical protein